MEWNKLATEEVLQKTIKALEARGFEVIVAENKEDAKKKALALIPEGSEVMHVTSRTLLEAGIAQALDEGKYVSLRKMIMAVTNDAERLQLRKKSTSPEYGIGSVHAVTEDGQVVIASASGSQLPVYAYGATNVIWVVSTMKIVKNLDMAFRRINEYILPLESERVRKEYKMPGSSVNKILIMEKERPGRIKLIFVKEKLGF